VNLRRHHSAGWLLVLLSALLFGCAGAKSVVVVTTPFADFLSPVRATCDMEAQQLKEKADVFPAPKSGLVPISKLDQGRFVYRCEQRGKWLGVMFPALGEKVDCAERRIGHSCLFGWIRSETKMEIFG